MFDFDPVALFLHDVPADVAAESADHVRNQSNTPFTERRPMPSWPDISTRFLLCRDDRFFPAEFQRRVAEERLGITPDEMPGGHLVALSHPTELADIKHLIVSLREIRAARPQQPLTLEVHEAAAADLCTMKMLRLVLDDLNMKLAYDERHARLAPGNMLLERVIQSGIASGSFRHVNLVGDPPWFKDWRPQEMPVFTIELYNGTAAGLALLAIRRVKQWLRSIFYRYRPRPARR